MKDKCSADINSTNKNVGLPSILLISLFLYLLKDLWLVKFLIDFGLNTYNASKVSYVIFSIIFYGFYQYIVFLEKQASVNLKIINKQTSNKILILLLGIALILTLSDPFLLNIQHLFLSLFSDTDYFLKATQLTNESFKYKLGSLAYGYLNISTVLFILIQIILAPIVEELLFRGLIQRKLNTKYSALISIFITSLIFCLFHFSSPLTAFVFSVIVGFVYLKTNKLAYTIIIHSMSNLIIWLMEGFGVFHLLAQKNINDLYSLNNWINEIIGLLMIFILLYYLIKKLNFIKTRRNE